METGVCLRQQVQQTREEHGEKIAELSHSAVLRGHWLDAVIFDASFQEALVPSWVLFVVNRVGLAVFDFESRDEICAEGGPFRGLEVESVWAPVEGSMLLDIEEAVASR